MTRILTITYDKSNEGESIIRVSKNNSFSTTIIRTFTGKNADRLYKILTGQNVTIKNGRNKC